MPVYDRHDMDAPCNIYKNYMNTSVYLVVRMTIPCNIISYVNGWYLLISNCDKNGYCCFVFLAVDAAVAQQP